MLDLGLEWAGWDVRWGCEIDPWCRALWEQRFERPCYGDARDLPDELERVDLLAGGFPCQPTSLAGKGLAQEDPRWLWPAFERAIRRLRPRYVLVENVLGLVNRGMADVLRDLAALGFDAEWTVFGASDLGAPHRRRRLWVVAAHADASALWDAAGGFFGPDWHRTRFAGHDGASCPVANTDALRRAGRPGEGRKSARRSESANGRGAAANADALMGRARDLTGLGEANAGHKLRGLDWWSAEPDVGRVAHGVPSRVDRLAALGNGVVPQCAELVGRRLMDVAA